MKTVGLLFSEEQAKKSFANEDIYLNRHKEFFTLYDTDNCKRNYEAVKAMKKR